MFLNILGGVGCGLALGKRLIFVLPGEFPPFLFNCLTVACMRPYLIFLSVLALFTCQGQTFSFNHLSVEDGLSQNSVLCVVQDSRGYLWYGTRYGLNKYDSRKFTVYQNRPGQPGSISNDYILSLLCDSHQTLWVGTRNGLNRYNAEKDIFERVPVASNILTDEDNKMINCIYQDSKGRLWVGTGGGLNLLTGSQAHGFISFTAATQPNFPAGGVRCVYEDHTGAIWVGATFGLTKMVTGANGFQLEKYSHNETNANSLSDENVTSMVEDGNHQLWIGTLNGGLNLYNPATNGFFHIREGKGSHDIVNNNIRKLCLDNHGNLWIGTQEGLSVMDIATQTCTNYMHDPWAKSSLSQNSIHSIYKDNTGTLWVGTFFGGVNSCFSDNTPFTVYQNGSFKNRLDNNVISSIVDGDKGGLWIGTEGGGLNYLNRQTGTVTYYQNKPGDAASLGSNLVKMVYKDKEGHIWVGTHGGGLNLFNPATKGFAKYLYKPNDPQTLGGEIDCILEDSRGLLWVGTEMNGVKIFLKKNTVLEPYGNGEHIARATGNAAIVSFLETSHKAVWIGTSAGLFIEQQDTVKALPGAWYINCLFEDRDGHIWAGTYYNGLVEYNAAGQVVKTYTREQGLPDNNVLGILQDEEGRLWISTGNGLTQFDTKQEHFQNYTEADGLAGNVFNNNSFYQSSSGELFFGGYNGLTSFFPSRIGNNKHVPPVVLTALRLFNKPVVPGADDKILSKEISFTEKLTFKHDQNVFTIDFAILNYIKPNKNRYAYKLDGFDNDWNYTTLPSASYTNLPPGNYHFIVKGTNNDGIWSQPATLAITVLPPFWKTWWAWCIYAAASLALVFFVARFFFLRALFVRNNELTQLKLNFFTNISHEIRTHLSLILGPAEKLLLTAKEDEQEQQQLKIIQHNSESLLQLVNELMDFRRAETGHLPLHVFNRDIVSFISAIHASFHDLSISKNIQADLITSADKIDLWFDKEQIEKVFVNLLSNAFKFTPEGGYISVSIEEKKESVEINVTNNGKGISKGNIARLFDNYFQEADYGQQNTGYGIGLALSKSVVEMHKGTLSVKSEPGEGSALYTTSFMVTLLKGNQHFEQEHILSFGKGHIEPAQVFTKQVPVVLNVPEALPANTDGTKYTLLLVEDNIAIRSFVKEAFLQQYNILESGNGREGWECAIEAIPDLIISDVMMPEMDGLTLCSKLKNDTRTSHIPVILLTAKTAQAHQVNGLQTGADIYLVKPFSIQVLALQVRNLLAARERLWQRFRSNAGLVTNDTAVADTVDATADATAVITPLHPLDEAFLQNILQIIGEHMEDPDFGIAMLAKKAAMSQPILFKKIKAITGMTANDYVKSLRLQRAAALLQENRYTVYQVAYMVGYESSRYFSREFRKQFGKAPSAYGEDEE